MSLLKLFKLEKLTIKAFTNAERTTPAAPPQMEVMFNPISYKRKAKIAYASENRRGINSSSSPARYSYTPPEEISLQFIFDGTGVAFMGLEQMALAASGRSVKSDIAKFEAICLTMHGNIHEPNFVKLVWGDHLDFPARLKSLDIAYKLFDAGGDPLRAELSTVFVEDIPGETGKRKANLMSPDLTHVRIVKSGDTLPLLCKEIYGSAAYYLQVAADNGLDDFRTLTPGQKLKFPPLKGGTASSAA